MAEGDQAEDRTEAATARHLSQARDEGQVPVSREIATFVSLAAVVLVLGLQSQSMMQRLIPGMVAFLSRSGDVSMLGSARIYLSTFAVLGVISLPVAAAMLSGAI